MVAEIMLRSYDVNRSFPKKISDDSFDVNKCLQQIEIPDCLHMWVPCSKLPSNISTMFTTECLQSLTQLYIVSYFIKWVNISLTYRMDPVQVPDPSL